VTVTFTVAGAVPSEIEIVAVPDATPVTVNVPEAAPDLVAGETVATAGFELEALKVPRKFVSLAVS
jgi:hypothetical protein